MPVLLVNGVARPCHQGGFMTKGSRDTYSNSLGIKMTKIEAGGDGILLMPPHHWLRFGRPSQTAIGFFQDVAEADTPIIVHQYPAWTKACLQP